MSKYIIIGVATFSLMVSTVYALNSNDKDNIVNNQIGYNQNCPYHENGEECPYYDEMSNTHNCLYNENSQHNHHGCGRQNRCHHK